MRQFVPCVAVCLLVQLLIQPLQAAENMTFHGELIEPPPCVINEGKLIDVDFGDLGVSKIDGVNYMQTVGYDITCEPGAGVWDLSLVVNGIPASFDPSAVQTSVERLGIRLLLDGKPFPVGKPILIDSDHRPILQVVPVKQPGTEALNEEAFEVTATFKTYYQ